MTSTPALVAAMKSRLESVLPGLAVAEGLPAVTTLLDYRPGNPDPAQTPRVWVDLGGAKRNDPKENGTALHRYLEERTILVAAAVAGDNPSESNQQLETFVDLIRQCVEGDQTAGGEAIWVRWIATEYGANLALDSGLVREAVLSFEAPRHVRLATE